MKMIYCNPEFLVKRKNKWVTEGKFCVPKSWLLEGADGNTYCWYPKTYTDGPEMEKKNIIPDPISFKPCKINFNKNAPTFDTYQDSYDALSDIEKSVANRTRGAKSGFQIADDAMDIISSSDDADDDDSDMEPTPKRRKENQATEGEYVIQPEQAATVTQVPLEITESTPNQGKTQPTLQPSTSQPISQPEPGPSSRPDNFLPYIDRAAVASIISNDSLNEVRREIEGVRSDLQELRDLLHFIIRFFNIPIDGERATAAGNPRDPQEIENVLSLPVNTQEQLTNVNTLVDENSALRLALKQRLIKCLLATVKDTVFSMMSTIMTKELASNYNWEGRGLKTGVQKMAITHVMKAALNTTKFKSEPDSEFVSAVMKWLQNTPARRKHELTRAEKVLQSVLDAADADDS